ncbi:hypothetical protein [Ilumatobacter nonamiensis]|uniref:hypothetical protein n=1 Tax=Ilumatobacter nonamiensis TaxID=467093 RepID=UPI00034A2FC3|nr:hypothetical protein [Ilumatobacter nonamiensis]
MGLIDDLIVIDGGFDWFERLGDGITLEPGQLTDSEFDVPIGEFRTVMNSVIRLVLDLPVGATPTVVWTLGDNELLVHSDETTVSCSSGVITVTAVVECDQCDKVAIPMPFGVGTRTARAGLVMSTFTDLQGPRSITDVWTDPLTAFAWETLLETARVICADVGNDNRGRPLVPGSIGAAPDVVLLQPIARHKLTAEA